jgi:hypothetical protein
METSIYFEKGSESITLGETGQLDVKDNYYKYFTSISIYLRNRYYMALEDYFNSLKYLWLEETKYSSNIYYTTKHPAYLKIIQLGKDVLPLILKDLSESNTHWFFALREISGANPIQNEHLGNIQEMTNDWLVWGKGMNYI